MFQKLLLSSILAFSAASFVSAQDVETTSEMVQNSEAENFATLKAKADKGDANAQVQIGRRYRFGEGIEKDPVKAREYFRLAAEQGDAWGQVNLGLTYEYGDGVDQNFEQAVKWYKKAADQDYASGQFNLGDMYENGKGVPIRHSKAMDLYEKAAEQGCMNMGKVCLSIWKRQCPFIENLRNKASRKGKRDWDLCMNSVKAWSSIMPKL